MTRLKFLDALRGLAVLWMIIFHFCYDLQALGFVSWDFSKGFWYGFPRVIAFTFLFCVGASLNFVHRTKINWSSLGKRSLKLGAAALVISISTYFIFPTSWIYFGTLHCILFSSILGALLVNRRPLAWALMVLILIGQYVLDYDIKWVSSMIQRHSMDFIPIYPWFWAVLLGMLLVPHLSKIRHMREIPDLPQLTFLGRHSLKIYLLHQPLIYGALWGIKSIL